MGTVFFFRSGSRILFLLLFLVCGAFIGGTRDVCAESASATQKIKCEYAAESEMVAESIRYLHKSVTALSKEKTPTTTRRIAPITTVIAGLLDAGVSPEEPLVRSGLDFLARFHADLKKRKTELSKADQALFKQIHVCLKKAKSSRVPSAVGSLPSLDSPNALVVTRGVGTSLRIRNTNQASLRKTIPAECLASNRIACDTLIAAVHGLKSFPVPVPFRPDIPRRPSELAAVLTPPSFSRDREWTGAPLDPFLCDALDETTLRLSVSYKIDSESRLLANNLSALRTTRRLE